MSFHLVYDLTPILCEEDAKEIVQENEEVITIDLRR